MQIEGNLKTRMRSTGVLLKSGRNGIVVTTNRIQADTTACSQEGSGSTRQSRIENWYETKGQEVQGVKKGRSKNYYIHTR